MQSLDLGRTPLTFLILFASIFIWNVGCLVWDLSRSSWPTTTAQITRVEIKPGPSQAPCGSDVSYSYTVGTRNYEYHTFFAPKPGLASGTTLSAGQQAQIYYNWVAPDMSTLDPGSQSGLNIVYIIIGAVGATLTLLGRPRLSLGKDMRHELPDFLDGLTRLVESGVSVPAAFEQTAKTYVNSCPNLCAQIDKCMIKLKVNQIPLHQSLAELGNTYQVNELNNLAATISAAQKTGSSVAYQLKQQSGALRFQIKAEKLAAENAGANLGARRYESSKKSWDNSPNAGAMSAQEIHDRLYGDNDYK